MLLSTALQAAEIQTWSATVLLTDNFSVINIDSISTINENTVNIPTLESVSMKTLMRTWAILLIRLRI